MTTGGKARNPSFFNATALATLLASLLWLSGCAVRPDVIPPAKQTTWVFQADIDSERGATVSLGDDREAVLKSLGRPSSRDHFKSDPTVEILNFTRDVMGPPRVRTMNTRDGYATIEDNIRYEDSISVYLKDGKVVSVTFDRSTQARRAGDKRMQPY